MKPKMIKDTLECGMKQVSKIEADVASRFSIPTFKGKLFELDDFGNEIFLKENTVVLGGAITALEHIFGTDPNYQAPSLNKLWNLNYNPDQELEHEHTSFIKLFGVGTGGSAMDFGQVYDPSFKQTELAEMVPFRISDVPSLDAPGALPGDANITERAKYFFMKEIPGDTLKYAWYLKEFEQDTVIRSLWKNAPDLYQDGTEIHSDEDVASGDADKGIECFGEAMLKITDGDIRPWFEANGNIEMARYNTLGLFSGKKILLPDGREEYINTRLFSAVNFENDSVKLRKETTYIYRVYSAL